MSETAHAPVRRRVAIFSHYDRRGIIDDYVVFYLQHLKEVAEAVIFVSDGDVPPSEGAKLRDITAYRILGRHGEYDFGSYKRGFQFAGELGLLAGVAELILCNDSCYGPILPLPRVFATMDHQPVDCYGITLSHYGIEKRGDRYVEVDNCPHLQSYFVVAREQVFRAQCFASFLASIAPLSDKMDVIVQYEIGFSRMLLSNGYKLGSYVPENEAFVGTHWIHQRWRELVLEHGSPFLKYQAISIYSADYLVFRRLFPVTMISKNLIARFGRKRSFLMRHPRMKAYLRGFRNWLTRTAFRS